MTIREAVASYIKRGWYPIPLKPGLKECVDDDWLERVYIPDEFEENQNVGLRLVDANDKDRDVKLIGVDLDCEEAVALVFNFLPKTIGWGRKSKKISQLLYISRFERPIVHKDLVLDTGKSVTLLEIRCGKQQSMCPPSVWHNQSDENPEVLSWLSGSSGEPLIIEAALLMRQVRLLGTACEIARHYNPQGDRHFWGMHLVGLLRHLGLTEDEAVLVIGSAGKFKNDNELRDRLSAIRSTYSRSEDDAVTGAKKLIESSGDVGEAFVASLRKIWGESGAGISRSDLERLNLKHAIIFQQSGDVVVITEDDDQLLRFSQPRVMDLLYPQTVVVGITARNQPIMKPLGQAWLKHPKRRFYHGIELAPGGDGNPLYYNLWRGFSVKPKKGEWSLFKRHIFESVASNNEEHYKYIISWMIETVQRPDQPIGISLAFRGRPGTGKTTFATWFGSLFGVHFLHLDAASQLTGRFNAHLHNAIIVFADEAAWPHDKVGMGALRRMVTDQTLFIERKGIDPIAVKNHVHLIVASNERFVVPRTMDDRRFAVFDVSDDNRNDRNFFASVRKQLFEDDGLAAMLYDMLETRVLVDVRVLPKTKAGDEQKQLSADPMFNWWLETLRTGHIGGRPWPKEVLYEELHSSYLDFVKAHYPGDRSPRSTQTQLGVFLAKYAPGHRQKKMIDEERVMLRVMPKLQECRDLWVSEAQLSENYNWDDAL